MLRVLVVDDEQDTSDGLRRLVDRWGHTARSAYDGVSALKIAAVQHPDIVLLDIEMPFMDGFEVARQLRRDFSHKECFIIALTGRGDDERRQQCNEAGIDLVLKEPVHPSVLEVLLMLEGEHMNRDRTGNSLCFGPNDIAPLPHNGPSARGRDANAMPRHSRRASALASGQKL